jgi:hypothetical protein
MSPELFDLISRIEHARVEATHLRRRTARIAAAIRQRGMGTHELVEELTEIVRGRDDSIAASEPGWASVSP